MKRKLSPFETYIALLKGYCAIAILIMPKAFQNGGWAASALLEVAAAVGCIAAREDLRHHQVHLPRLHHNLPEGAEV